MEPSVAEPPANGGQLAQTRSHPGINPEGFVVIAAAKQATTLRLAASPKFDTQIFSTVGVATGTVIVA